MANQAPFILDETIVSVEQGLSNGQYSAQNTSGNIVQYTDNPTNPADSSDPISWNICLPNEYFQFTVDDSPDTTWVQAIGTSKLTIKAI